MNITDITTLIPTDIIWGEADASSYSADKTVIGARTVLVCLDDEGPLHPAFYWWVTDAAVKQVVSDGWASSVDRAKSDAVAAAVAL